MSNEIKTAAYICKGCGLGERLDTDQLVNVAGSECGASISRSHDYLCSSDGLSLIRAGRREEVLGSGSMWMCTSCYGCIVRCPRGLPITHIMHGLANYANRLGLAPKMNPTKRFAKIFWDNISVTGRVNETRMSIRLYFMDGFLQGVRNAFAMRNVGLGMLITRRFNPFGLFLSGGIKQKSQLQQMLKKAYEIEDKRKGFN